MVRTLRLLLRLMGWACVAIGLLHVALGNAAIPGASSAGATIDSWGRFMGASFVGYGLAWLWTARQSPIPGPAVRALAGVMLLGGLSRLVSLAVAGRPQWFQLVLMAIELGAPPVYLWLASAETRAVSGAVGNLGGGAAG